MASVGQTLRLFRIIHMPGCRGSPTVGPQHVGDDSEVVILSRNIPLVLAAASLTLGACQSGTSPALAGAQVFTPPSKTFAQGAGITAGPISADQAKQIAAAAVPGGTATSVEQEDDDGVQVFGVKVQAAGGNKDVKVRISDGAVTRIDPDTPDTAGGEGAPEG